MQVRLDSVRPGSPAKAFFTDGVWVTCDVNAGTSDIRMGREGRRTVYRHRLPKVPTLDTFGALAEAEVNLLLRQKRLAWGPKPKRRKSGRPRDRQKTKLYRSEELVPYWGQDKMSELSDVRFYVQKLTQSAWWKARYPDCPYITVNKGKGRGGYAYATKKLVTLPEHAWHPMYILHEVAHVATYFEMGKSFDNHEAHGPEYCRVYLELVEHVIGPEVADDLRTAMFRMGVKYS